MRFSQNNFHHELLPYRRLQLLKFCIYGHKISQSYSIMTDNLKHAGIFRKFTFFYGVCYWLLHFEYLEFSLMSSKKPTTQWIKNSQHIFCLQTVLKLARWQVWWKLDFAGLGTSRSETIQLEIQFLYSFMKYDYEKLFLPSFREFYKISIDI